MRWASRTPTPTCTPPTPPTRAWLFRNLCRDRPFATAVGRCAKERDVSLGLILIIILVLLLVGALPSWGYSRSWGYFPSGGLGLILVIIIVLVLLGRI